MPLTLIKHRNFFFFTVQTCFVLQWANLTFLWGKRPIQNKLVTFFNWWRPASSEKTAFLSQIPLVWIGFRLMAKNDFCVKKGILSEWLKMIFASKNLFMHKGINKRVFLFFTYAHKPKFWLYLRIYFDLSLSLSFFFLCLSCLLAVCPLYRLFLHGIVAVQLFMKGKKLFFKEQQINSDIGSGFFLEMLPFLWVQRC